MKKLLKGLLNFGKKHGNQVIACPNHPAREGLVNALALEYCQSCSLRMCYQCSGLHIQGGCLVSLAQIITSKNLSKGKVNDYFNQGYPTLFDFQRAKCICQKQLRDCRDSAICAACGSGTCSKECHDLLVAQGQCTFYKNFSLLKDQKKPSSLRSITYENYKKQLHKSSALYQKINVTSQQFISAYIAPSSSQGNLLLQRGFRQYGNPSIPTLKCMQIMKDTQLDYHLFNQRQCFCSCSKCRGFKFHSVEMCQLLCIEPSWIKFRQNSQKRELQNRCNCTCKVCDGTKLTGVHLKWECSFHCCLNK